MYGPDRCASYPPNRPTGPCDVTIELIVFDENDIDPSVGCHVCGEIGWFGLGVRHPVHGHLSDTRLTCEEHLSATARELASVDHQHQG